ncbi:MAG TPA: ABC transporter substrate-binding protein/permease [Thermoanaerobaculia bacterium]|nr:ABC transporter substrate-binding protein/permease [Thermoanaerobaculia bacterium]
MLRPFTLVAAVALAGTASAGPPPELRWGGDAEGGAPIVQADPQDPSKVRGFDVDVAEAIARGLGRRARFVQCAFASIDQSVARGDFDLGMSGVEETPARRAALAVTIPYFEFREVLTVREADAARFRGLADLKRRRVGTLGGTIAYDLLLGSEKTPGIEAVSYDDDVHPYEDLAKGRLDGVVLDHILAARSVARVPGLVIQPEALAVGHYVIVLAKGNEALRDRIDDVLRARMKDGALAAIFRRWGVWDEGEGAFFERTLAAAAAAEPRATAAPSAPARPPEGRLAVALRYVPALLRAALVTIALSCLAMALAIACGVLIASGRVYGRGLARALLTGYVELMRGTPVLLQLFVLYYGLSALVRLPAFVAALLGLGLNYAAYESEIYRGALEAVPRGQLEAARTLGLTEMQVFSLVRGPQAFRLALAPMTNDFVALLKDSSLVSVITVVELTKETSIFAANVGSWAIPGALCAALYLLLSLPLSRLARRLEERWRAPS